MRKTEIRSSAFAEKIDSLILKAWQEGCRTFKSILLNLPGVYPAEVLSGLRRLCSANRIQEVDAVALALEAASKPHINSDPVGLHDRKIEHPIDFEWLFSKAGAARICEEIKTISGGKPFDILCLGCPGVYGYGKRHHKEWNFRLWDKNVTHLGQIEEVKEVSCVDVCDGVDMPDRADLVVIDPPWYNPFYFLFIWAASHCLNKSGRIVLSFPPEGTRPGVKEDRREFILWCKRNGYTVERRLPCALNYRTPLFEVNALKAQGVANFPLDWRRGDLIVLRKISQGIPQKPDMEIPKEEWQEVWVGHVRIKVCSTRRLGRGLLTNAATRPVLPTVSSHHPARKVANVVTSGNRFLVTKAPDEFIACLKTLKPNGSKSLADNFIAAKNPLLKRKALNLILTEQTEVANYFRRINEI